MWVAGATLGLPTPLVSLGISLIPLGFNTCNLSLDIQTCKVNEKTLQVGWKAPLSLQPAYPRGLRGGSTC